MDGHGNTYTSTKHMCFILKICINFDTSTNHDQYKTPSAVSCFQLPGTDVLYGAPIQIFVPGVAWEDVPRYIFLYRGVMAFCTRGGMGRPTRRSRG